jgi:putative ABC transport system substrate-binding protein
MFVGGAMALLGATARAETGKVHRVGLIQFGAPGTGILAPDMAQNFARRGYIEGRNLTLDRRAAAGKGDSLPGIIAELTTEQVEVIITQGYPPTAATKHLAGTTPVVATFAGDLVDTNLVATIARPGGNITGVSDFATELSPKRLALLTEAVPTLRRIALLYDAADPAMTLRYQAVTSGARQLNLSIVPFGLREPNDFDPAFAEMSKVPPDAIMLVTDVLTASNRQRVIQYAQEHRIPTMFEYAFLVHDGGLLSYGAHLGALFDRATDLAVRILNGANPAELPIEFPTRFQFAANLKTAKSIGLTLPASVLARADEVIE